MTVVHFRMDTNYTTLVQIFQKVLPYIFRCGCKVIKFKARKVMRVLHFPS